MLWFDLKNTESLIPTDLTLNQRYPWIRSIMDPMIFLDVSNELTKLKMFPYFDIAHFVVTCLYLREDLSTGESKFVSKWTIELNCWFLQGLILSLGNTHSLVGYLQCSPLLLGTYCLDSCLGSQSWTHSKARITSFWPLQFGNQFVHCKQE